MLKWIVGLFRKSKAEQIEDLLSYENTIKEKEKRVSEEPKSQFPIVNDAIELVKHFEGFKSEAYKDIGGVWTIGYGTTEGVKEGDAITEEEATTRMLGWLQRNKYIVLDLVEVQLSDAQLGAIMSFVYNVGVNAFKNSTMLVKLNKGDYTGAANEFERWVHVNGQRVNGLVRRRNAERALFKGEDYTIYMR